MLGGGMAGVLMRGGAMGSRNGLDMVWMWSGECLRKEAQASGSASDVARGGCAGVCGLAAAGAMGSRLAGWLAELGPGRREPDGRPFALAQVGRSRDAGDREADRLPLRAAGAADGVAHEQELTDVGEAQARAAKFSGRCRTGIEWGCRGACARARVPRHWCPSRGGARQLRGRSVGPSLPRCRQPGPRQDPPGAWRQASRSPPAKMALSGRDSRQAWSAPPPSQGAGPCQCIARDPA